MDYNTTRPALKNAEYGRQVQAMADYALTLPEKADRTLAVAQILRAYAVINPQYRENQELRRKLWDYIHEATDYQMDCDGPFPTPTHEEKRFTPGRVAYATGRIKARHYGHNLQGMIAEARKIEEGPLRDEAAAYIAGFMRMVYRAFNKNTVQDETIVTDLLDMSEGELRVAPSAIVDVEAGQGRRTSGIGQYGSHGGHGSSSGYQGQRGRQFGGGGASGGGAGSSFDGQKKDWVPYKEFKKRKKFGR